MTYYTFVIQLLLVIHCTPFPQQFCHFVLSQNGRARSATPLRSASANMLFESSDDEINGKKISCYRSSCQLWQNAGILTVFMSRLKSKLRGALDVISQFVYLIWKWSKGMQQWEGGRVNYRSQSSTNNKAVILIFWQVQVIYWYFSNKKNSWVL